MSGAPSLDPADLDRSLANLRLERDAIVLYDRLAGIEKDERRQAAFRAIAANERRHADIWASRLRDAGMSVPAPGRPRVRIQVILGLARIFGTRAVSDLVKSLEGDEEEAYEAQGDPEVAGIMDDEREHAEIWQRLDAGLPGVINRPEGSTPDVFAPGTAAVAGIAAAGLVPASAGSPAVARKDETWHRAGRTGTLRAAIFGVNDGLVSNLALVMGVAGAAVDNRFIVLAGIAGLLAGSFSMAAGEYVSMQSQRELFQRQIDLEREEMKIMPEAEQNELAAIYRAKGLSRGEAALVAQRLMQDPETALDTKVREELGLDPDELGSPWGAAAYSFVAFGVGAAVPLLPFLLSSGVQAAVVSVVLALGSLFLVGAAVSLLTGRSAAFSGARQVAIGGAAAAVTYVVGLLIGVQA
ncbi:MAG: vacuolar iron transporter family protein [Chloroflexota bacterium]|jgi:VIT1/CCC1 family predicted Fe2+/Mn2+ transporter|nr:vacuolar iron transporter family protein [Chloroflexota bacterium]